MSEPNPYQQLGIAESAPFEEIQSAKAELLVLNEGNPEVRAQIEKAYDAILMERLKLRQQGKIKVPDGIRFAEQPRNPVAKPLAALPPARSTGGLTAFWQLPELKESIVTSIFYSLLLVFSINSVLNPSTGIALGILFALYRLTRRTGKFGRSVLWNVGGISLGITIAAVVVNVLHLSVAAIGLTPLGFTAALIFFFLWFICSFVG
jgi:hypothetical protein